MTQTIIKYASELFALKIPSEAIGESVDIFKNIPDLYQNLSDESVSLEKKHNIIIKVFPSSIRDFIMILCDNNDILQFDEIAKAYKTMKPKSTTKMEVEIIYVTKPTDEQLLGIENFISKKYNDDNIEFNLIEDKSIGSGFIIRTNSEVFDWSKQGRIDQLEEKFRKNIGTKTETLSGIISILKSEIEDFELVASQKEVGFVTWVGDGIVNIDGIDHAMYGEIVMFDTGDKGMIQDIKRNEIGCILFGNDDNISEGTRVIRTGKQAGIPVGEAYLGRVVNALGAPIDGKGGIEHESFRPIESPAPSIVERKSVCEPLETGILSIDSMFPIGRGQRELIIGDRQTGKTSIAIDAILNQKGKDVVCVYVAIGQKASTVAKIVNTLEKHDALSYSIIVAATASDSASLQYIAPYSGTSLAEYFMYQGKDVLIVYDDLSKHAVAYRALSLLLERSPGREAYPGDVFYLHSRLLERSSNLLDSIGGSITALPIIETQAGDVSAYIPTNVISITDGQIFLESNLFFSGMRPAVNVGLSVSRVGGAAQTKAMKKASGSIRIDLAQYREMEIFTQFSSDLDETTKMQLEYGKGLMELLKQPLCHPLAHHEQVIILLAATNKVFVGIPIKEIKNFQNDLLYEFNNYHMEIVNEINTLKKLSDDLIEDIVGISKALKEQKFDKD